MCNLFVYCNDKMAGSFFWRRTDDLSEIEKAVIGDTVPTEAIEVRVYIYIGTFMTKSVVRK